MSSSIDHAAPAPSGSQAPAAPDFWAWLVRRDTQAKPPSSLLNRYAWLILILLTLFAGFIRFAWIDRPTCWNDEAHTFRRLTGDFKDLLAWLQIDGFGPLHYEIYWAFNHWDSASAGKAFTKLLQGQLAWTDLENVWSGNPASLTPFWMRLLPSLAGTFMVPAMYFLARQVCSKRTSLLTAAFTACSAYLMVYAHDGKMYMHLWLFGVLNIASLLWWFRSNLRFAWLCWIAAGLALAGTHAPGLLLLGLQPLFLLTQSNYHWKKFLLFLIGLAVIASGPAVHYLSFNRWTEKVDENWSAAGLGWVPGVLNGRDGSNLLLFASGAYLYSWEWPRDSYDDRAERTVKPVSADPRLKNAYMNEGFRQMLQGFHIDSRILTGLMSAIVIMLALAALGAFPWPRALTAHHPDDPPTQAWWRSLLWLSMWLILPAYAFFAASMPDFTGPQHWLQALQEFCASLWAGRAATLQSYRALARPQVILIAVVLFWIAALAFSWRFLPPVARLLLPEMLAIALLLIILKPMLFNPRQPPANWWLIPRALYHKWAAVVSDPRLLLPAMFLLPLLAFYFSGQNFRQRLARLGQFVLVLLAMYALLAGLYAFLRVYPLGNETGVWIPRYVAIVWPAFAIALCASLMRLPTRTLRYAAIAILLGTNLAQAWGRMFAGSEPRVDLMMHDVCLADEPNSPVRTYLEDGPETAHPAGGTVENRPGKYFAAITKGHIPPAFRPQTFLSASTNQALNLPLRMYTNPETIPVDARRAPGLQRLIVWDRLLSPPPADQGDDLLPRLGPDWKQTGQAFYPVRYHWNWSDLYLSRRREYVRQAN